MEIDHFFPAKCPDFLVIFFALDCSIPSFDSNPQVLLVVSVLGFFVNLVGIFVFHHGGAAGKNVLNDNGLLKLWPQL